MNLSFGSAKKPFWAAIVGLSILVFGLIIAVIVLAQPKPNEKDITNYCYKSECLKYASEILDSVNTTVDPCNDFYQHVCGKWIHDTRIPPGQDKINTIRVVGNIVMKRLTDLLQEDPSHDEASAVTKAKIFFKSCMDLESIEDKSLNIMKAALQDMKRTSSLEELVNFLINYNANVLVPSYVNKDPKNVSRNLITVYSTNLMLSSKAYYNKSGEVYTAFRASLDGLSDILGNVTDEIIDFEWKLMKIHPEQNMNESATYNLMTIGDLRNLTQGQVNWTQIFQQAVNNSGSTARVDDDTIVWVPYPEHVIKLADILKATDLNTLTSYAALNYMVKHHDAMPAKYRDLFNKAKLTTSKPREVTCVISVRRLMPNAIGRLYVDNYFPESSTKKAVELVMSLRIALEEMFKETKWMDEETRIAAMDKVKNVLPFIGYNEAIKENWILNWRFRNVNFTKDQFMMNVIEIDNLGGRSSFANLETVNKRNSWKVPNIAVVNAFYVPFQNAIYLPAGILQSPLYDPQYPLSLLFGAMGMVVGHEFVHGFDTTGAHFDKMGNLRNWWTEKSLENFHSRASALKKDYADYPICKHVPNCDMHINGNLTIGENIADNGGVKAAFKAYKGYVKSHAIKQKVLPGLSYTSDQLFFVGFAHLWCSKIKPKALIHKMQTDVHSPGMARVIITLRNNEAFSTAFKCKKGSKMNPTKKHGVW